MQRKKINLLILLPSIVAILLYVGYSFGKYVANERYTNAVINSPISQLMQSGNKFSEVLRYIEGGYIDKIDVDTLTEEFIPKIISKLDPHSLYVPAKDVMKSNENLEGSFDGIGITFNMVIDTLVVLEVIPGGPSSKVGLEMGDRIMAIDGENIAGIKANQDSVVSKLRGVGGTIVNLSVEREGFKERLDIAVTRGKVAINSLDAAVMLKPTIGYIKLLRFSKTTHQEVTSAIDSLTSLGMETLIFDLKSNFGGYLDQAIYIANEFLPKESMIVYTEGRGKMMGTQFADGTGRFTDHSLYVLIDDFSASSSEIVAGAIQDNDRGVIIGRRSYGKGLVQQQVPLSDGSIINLTIARYHTPSGRCIQKPYKLGEADKYNMELVDRFKKSEHLSVDSLEQADTVKYYTKSNRVVYGGGGITPDVFVPIDTTMLSPFMIKAMASINIIKFATKYSAKHKEEFMKFDNVNQIKEYMVKNGDAIYNEYVNHLVAIKVIKSHKVSTSDKNELIKYLSAYIAMYSPLGSSAFYAIIYELDDITSKAVELIENNVNINNLNIKK